MKYNNDLLLLRGDDIVHLLDQQEAAVLDAVAQAYQMHAKGLTAMPPDSYLRFPGMEKERIISKVAYLGGEVDVAGVKWIASFPGNVQHGMERASATLILNSTATGRPRAVMESSIISAKRTAASAALGAKALSQEDTVSRLGLIGCGYINFETLRFLLHVFPDVEEVDLFDLSLDRMEQFKERALRLKAGLSVHVQEGFPDVLARSTVLALATTAIAPHIMSLAGHQPGSVLLHTSLRDFTPNLILQADNVVDDIDKVCSNSTSVHLAEQRAGNRDFIRSTIGDILNGNAPPRDASKPFSIYSPFGLGILDMAVAERTAQLAAAQGRGTVVESFLPSSWLDR